MSTFTFTPKNEEKFSNILKKYPHPQSLMLPSLWLAQEQEGFISTDAMEYIATKIEVAPIEVYRVVTFYTMFNLEKIAPYHIEVCKTLSCKLCGQGEILKYIEEKTANSDKFKISKVECMGACGGAPIMALNGVYHENLTTSKVDEILREIK